MSDYFYPFIMVVVFFTAVIAITGYGVYQDFKQIRKDDEED